MRHTPLDPVTLAVLQGRLEQIADEMDATLFRTAFNPIIAEARDASHGLYDAETGQTLVQGKAGLPIFAGAMAFAVKSVIDREAAAGGPRDGDVWLFNDPYDGGTHLNDFKLVRAYFHDGRPFVYLASVGHWHDVGGAVPGNYNPSATECHQEAVLIPPVRVVEAGSRRQDILDILTANSRQPQSVVGDLSGQLNALDLGARRLDALIAEQGAATVAAAFAELTERAARLMRARLAELPDGTWSGEDFLDNDGIDPRPLKVALDLTKAGEHLTLDFSRSSPPCAGPVNIAYSTAAASCYVALKHLFPDVPANGGVLAPISFVIPPSTFLNVRAPRPVGGYTETILRVIDLIFSLFARIAPERGLGNAYGTINALSIAGGRPDGGRWVMFSFFGGGHGGHAQGDGLNHGNAPISTATIPPVEILESAYPVLFRQWALRPDSGGAGEHRGGLGAIYEIELLADDAQLFLFGERGTHPPQGVCGGGPAARNRFLLPGPDGAPVEPPLVSKLTGLKLRRGQRVRLETPGGGGYGDPARRDPAAIDADVAQGYVTVPSA